MLQYHIVIKPMNSTSYRARLIRNFALISVIKLGKVGRWDDETYLVRWSYYDTPEGEPRTNSEVRCGLAATLALLDQIANGSNAYAMKLKKDLQSQGSVKALTVKPKA